jgi:hypothetical protein
MGSVAGALEVDHAVQAGVGCAIALVAVGVQLLLSEDIPTVLLAAVRSQRPLYTVVQRTSRGEGPNRTAERGGSAGGTMQ